MVLNFLFFGAIADEIGTRSREITLKDGIDAHVGLDQIMNEFPVLRGYQLRFAVNQEYVADDRVLNDGDELAIFTAVSGG